MSRWAVFFFLAFSLAGLNRLLSSDDAGRSESRRRRRSSLGALTVDLGAAGPALGDEDGDAGASDRPGDFTGTPLRLLAVGACPEAAELEFEAGVDWRRAGAAWVGVGRGMACSGALAASPVVRGEF